MKQYRRPLSWIGFLGVAGLAVSMAGAGLVSNRSEAESVVSTFKPPNPRVVCFGHVDMEQGVTPLHPLVPGRVIKLGVKEGQAVKAGEVVLQLEDILARARIREARADLEASRGQLKLALKLPEQQLSKVVQQKAAIEAVQHRLEAAQHAFARKEELEKIQQLNSREVDAARALVEELKAVARAEKGKLQEVELNDPSVGVARARADIEAKQARLDQAQRGADECLLRAPADGIVLRLGVTLGEVLTLQPKQAAVLFCPKGARIVRAEVEQEFAGGVKEGKAAAIEDDTHGGPSWRGKVIQVSDWFTHRRSILQEPFQFNDVRTIECLVAIDPGQEPLRIGQRVRVSIER